MDSAFNLEDWLCQAGLEHGVIANVAAKLREEECASVSALKEADDAILQSIGIKAFSRKLILKACAGLVYAPASTPGGSSPHKTIPAAPASEQLVSASPPPAPGAAAAGSVDPCYAQKYSRYIYFDCSRLFLFFLSCHFFSASSSSSTASFSFLSSVFNVRRRRFHFSFMLLS
jgi:hypothetical protein